MQNKKKINNYIAFLDVTKACDKAWLEAIRCMYFTKKD